MREKVNGRRLLDIHCSSCGSPAEYNIEKHTYCCAYCGNETSTTAAAAEKRGFRKLHTERLNEQRKTMKSITCRCSGCGAVVVFPENDVLQTCSFCGRALVRGDYLTEREFPELVIPFRLTKEEAKNQFEDWCRENHLKREAKHLKKALDTMEGYYLPYALVRGPLRGTVAREGADRIFQCGGFLDGIFVNASSHLDNLTLNGMEPFDLNELEEFDFGYLAKQKAKAQDISGKDLDQRIKNEVRAEYTPLVQKTLETRGIEITPDTEDLLNMPVLLPVYYVSQGNVCAALNGQTGKISVRCEKVRKTLPWWLKPIFATVLTITLSWLVLSLLMKNITGGLYISGMLTVVMALIYYTGYSNAYEGTKRTELERKLFVSGNQLVRNPDGTLTPSDEPVPEVSVEPMFFENIDGKRTRVKIRFSTPGRIVKMMILALTVMFLPLILAFIFNGFDYHGLHPGHAAVWLCIFVPVVPAYLMKMGRIDIYENPYIYRIDENGKEKRIRTKSRTTTVWEVLRILFTPPLIWAGLFILLVLFMNTYLIITG